MSIALDPLAPEHASRLAAALAPIAARLHTPALVVDLEAVAHNARAFVTRCGGAERWRPHVKTAKQHAVVDELLAAGVRSFKCATPAELRLVLQAAAAHPGAPAVDVLVAYPPSPPALASILAARAEAPQARVGVLADSPEHLRTLDDAAPSEHPLAVHLDVDLGMHRTGSLPSRWCDLPMPRAGVRIAGLHGYDGHHPVEARAAAHAGYDALVELARALALDASHDLVTSGTHSYAHALDHRGLCEGPWRHQVSPGTIVFSDLRSRAAARDIGLRQAAFVATRVISRPSTTRVTVDAGSKGIAPDCPGESARVVGWPGLRAETPSEEHLPLTVASGACPRHGELLWLVPMHVCTSVNLHDEVVYVRGGSFVGTGTVAARGHAPLLEPASVEPASVEPAP
jgi:D-serine deaminase-like pyridoxal phosphate-dependent protein